MGKGIAWRCVKCNQTNSGWVKTCGRCEETKIALTRTKGEEAEMLFERMIDSFKGLGVHPPYAYGLVRDFIAAHFDWVNKDPADFMAEWIASTSVVYDRHNNCEVMTSDEGPFFLCDECKGTGTNPPYPSKHEVGHEKICLECDGQGVFSNDAEGYN